MKKVVRPEECMMCHEVNHTDNSTFIKTFKHGVLYLNPVQIYKGRCYYTLKSHVTDLTEIDTELFGEFSKELLFIARALKKCFSADLINIAMLCNVEPHLHWHIIPRYDGDHNWGHPPWPTDPKDRVPIDEEECQRIVSLIRNNLEQI